MPISIMATVWAVFCPPWERTLPMTAGGLTRMFGDIPHSAFCGPQLANRCGHAGRTAGGFIQEQSGGLLDYTWPAQVNRMIPEGGFDLVLSFGQVVPHEVIGMANYNKNILIGTAGPLSIDRSHYLGAVVGMERIMGRADNPVRRVLNRASGRISGQYPYRLCVDRRWHQSSGRAGGARLVRGG